MKHKGAVLYIARLLTQRLLGIFCYLFATGWIFSGRGLVYCAVYLLMALVCGLILYRKVPETIAHRNQTNTNSPLWDKVLLTAYWLLAYFGIYIAIGMEDGGSLASLPFWLGMGLYLGANGLTMAAMLANPYLESTARVQSDRNQTVCDSGPYAIIRHPTYAAILLWALAICLMFPGKRTIPCALLCGFIIVIRTFLEDKMLQKELPGYADYCRRTRWCLVPYLW